MANFLVKPTTLDDDVISAAYHQPHQGYVGWTSGIQRFLKGALNPGRDHGQERREAPLALFYQKGLHYTIFYDDQTRKLFLKGTKTIGTNSKVLIDTKLLIET